MSFDIGLGRKSHDLVLTQAGGLVFINGPDKVLQDVKIRLLAYLGDWFLDSSYGIPYFESILVKNPDRIMIESLLRVHIVAVNGVRRVNALNLAIDHTQRTAKILFEFESDWGTLNSEVYLNELRSLI